MPSAVFGSTMRWRALLLAAALSCERDGADSETPAAVVAPVAIEEPATYWERSGFVEMVPPIRLPSAEGRERIAVWLRIPDGERIGVVPGAGGRPTLTFPSGAVADRLDMRDGEEAGSVQDVRGTRFELGREVFHVLRPIGPSRLVGVEWPRGDEAASREATATMRAQLAWAMGTNAATLRGRRALDLFERLNDCGGCHVHNKPEERASANRSGLPNRASDANGLYTIATVLDVGAPLETHRALDRNENDPYVSVACLDGNTARLQPRGEQRHFVCADGSVPYATLDLERALAHEDPHARAVCRSRRYLYDHMDATGRSTFAAAFTACGE
jgi:hypothetical protein